jgi:rubrerythrin
MKSKEKEAEKVLEALNKGIELETRGIRFFNKSFQKLKDPKGRQTLKFLANEERDHLRFIREMKESFLKSDERIKKILHHHKSKKGPKVFPKLENFIKEVTDSYGDKLVLEEAEEIEKRSIAFYKNSGKEIENKDYKEIFKALVKEEEGHLALVQQMSDYMKLHGVWAGLEDYFVNE